MVWYGIVHRTTHADGFVSDEIKSKPQHDQKISAYILTLFEWCRQNNAQVRIQSPKIAILEMNVDYFCADFKDKNLNY